MLCTINPGGSSFACCLAQETASACCHAMPHFVIITLSSSLHARVCHGPMRGISYATARCSINAVDCTQRNMQGRQLVADTALPLSRCAITPWQTPHKLICGDTCLQVRCFSAPAHQPPSELPPEAQSGRLRAVKYVSAAFPTNAMLANKLGYRVLKQACTSAFAD